MFNRLVGMTDEESQTFEEAHGIKAETARLLIDQAISATQKLTASAIKELQSVVGPHGALSRVQAGNMMIAPGVGIGVFQDGVLKTTIDPDGNLLVGSKIDDPAYTSLAVFVNDQVYNNEQMGAGDLLIGDNTSGVSNVKYDASEGQLQFRLGVTINVYMDTDGSLKAGAGAVVLDQDGITIPNAGDAILISVDDPVQPMYYRNFISQFQSSFAILVGRFTSITSRISNGDFATGDFTNWTETDPGSKISVESLNGDYAAKFDAIASLAGSYISQNLSSTAAAGCVVYFRAKTSATIDVAQVTAGGVNYGVNIFQDWRNYHIKVYGSVSSIQITAGISGTCYIDDIFVYPTAINSYLWVQGSETVDGGALINYRNLDNSHGGVTQIKGSTDNNLIYADATNDKVGIGTATPAEKLDVVGNITVSGSILGAGAPKAEVQTNDLFRCDAPGGTSAWAGTFTAAGSSGTTIKYATTSGTAASMKPTATTQLGKMRLYNTTRGNSVLIQDWVAGTITSTANYPANWANGDVLTIASQTVSGGGVSWVDIEITSGPTGKTYMFLNLHIASATAGDTMWLHPFETYNISKTIQLDAQVANVNITYRYMGMIKINSNVFSMQWTGTPGKVIVREAGYLA